MVAVCPGPATKPSPLHCLENSLKGILPEGPLRFGCLAGLGPSPRSSSSSSISSSEGEDPRPEPELWQPLLQGELVGARGGLGARPQCVNATLTPALFLPERDHPPSGKGLGTLSPQRGGPCAGCSPGEGLRRLEPGHRCDFSAGEPGVSGGRGVSPRMAMGAGTVPLITWPDSCQKAVCLCHT